MRHGTGWMTRWRGGSGTAGFTLIELLVVIVIIGMLAGILMPAFNRTRQRGRVAQGKAEAAALATAIKSYFTHYGYWPCPDKDTADLFTYENGNVASVVGRLSVTSTTHNPDEVQLLDREDLRFSPDGQSVVGPWGEPYRIEIDTRYPGPDAELVEGVRVSFLNWRGERQYP
jgi:prepilin-type N-terminal cleavage/methylation domain-containing protein